MDNGQHRQWLMNSRKHRGLSHKRDLRFTLLSEIDKWELPDIPVSSGRGTSLYLLLDPRDRTVRYVGVSSRPFARLQYHIEQPGNRLLRSWAAELRMLHMEPMVHIVGEVCENNWAEVEALWISFFRSKGMIYNVHSGGAFQGDRGRPTMTTIETRPMSYRDSLAEVRHLKQGVVRRKPTTLETIK